MSRKKVQDQRRKQILEALHKRLLIKPFDKTSIKEIAEEAQLNHGMLHYYFKSKDDILLAYIDYSLYMYRGLFVDWLHEHSGRFESKEAFVYEMLDFMGRKITLNRDLSRIFVEIWEIGNYNETVREKLRETYGEWITVVTRFLSDQFGDGEKTKTLGMAIVAFSEGLSLLSVIFDEADFPVHTLIGAFRGLIASRM